MIQYVIEEQVACVRSWPWDEPVFRLCPLCSQQKQLEKSHYLGRALHVLCQDDNGAVFMTPQRIELLTRQIWAHLLCGECEDILASKESYAHQWINRKNRFPLLERCVAAPVRWPLNGTEFSGNRYLHIENSYC